jgi:hypothetical protein
LQYDKKQKLQSKRLYFDDATIDSDSKASGSAASIGDNRSTSSSTTIPDRVFGPKKKTEAQNKIDEKGIADTNEKGSNHGLEHIATYQRTTFDGHFRKVCIPRISKQCR